MPRRLRIEYEGAIYHVMSRGDRGRLIFLDDVDRQDFLKTLAEACQKTGFAIHAYCLMRNHFHLVVETPQGNLVEGMRWMLSAYTIRLNHRHQLRGHVFSGRYKAVVVDGSGDGYLRTACDYVHLNPARAKLLGSDGRLLEYPWSSLGLYLAAPQHRPDWLRVDRLLGEHGIGADSAAGRRDFERRMETRRREEGDPRQWHGLRRGWCLGGKNFRQNMLERMNAKLGPNHAGELRRQNEERKAGAIIAAELRRRGQSETDFLARRRNDPEKIAVALRLRRETTITIETLARRLAMGHRNTVRNLLAKAQKSPKRNK